MRLRNLCGAILTLMLISVSVFATPHEQHKNSAPSIIAMDANTTQATPLEIIERPSSIDLNETQAEIAGPLKYSVWVLIGLGPLMWIWLALFPRFKKK